MALGSVPVLDSIRRSRVVKKQTQARKFRARCKEYMLVCHTFTLSVVCVKELEAGAMQI